MTLQILRSLFSWGEGGGFLVFFDNLVNAITTNFDETHKITLPTSFILDEATMTQ
jgi:hypothetical protein